MYHVAAISDLGWVDDPATTLNSLFTYYLLSDAAQSLLYQNEIKSMSQAYYGYINDPTGMANQVTSDLQELLSKYFVQVDVSCKAKEITQKYYAVVIRASVVTEKNERLELSKVMEIDSNNLRKIIDVNNYGDGLNVISSI